MISACRGRPDGYSVRMTSRDALGAQLRGRGIEVGPGHVPFPVGPGASVQFVDRLTSMEHHELFPEVPIETGFVEPDIVADLDTDGLRTIESNSQDFVIALARRRAPLRSPRLPRRRVPGAADRRGPAAHAPRPPTHVRPRSGADPADLPRPRPRGPRHRPRRRARARVPARRRPGPGIRAPRRSRRTCPLLRVAPGPVDPRALLDRRRVRRGVALLLRRPRPQLEVAQRLRTAKSGEEFGFVLERSAREQPGRFARQLARGQSRRRSSP